MELAEIMAISVPDSAKVSHAEAQRRRGMTRSCRQISLKEGSEKPSRDGGRRDEDQEFGQAELPFWRDKVFTDESRENAPTASASIGPFVPALRTAMHLLPIAATDHADGANAPQYHRGGLRNGWNDRGPTDIIETVTGSTEGCASINRYGLNSLNLPVPA